MGSETKPSWAYGCTNHGCMFGGPPGMATNGPCHCNHPRTPEERARLRENVRGALEAAREEGRWRRIDEEAPEEDQVVIFFVPYATGPYVYVATYQRGTFHEHNAGYDGDSEPVDGATHWMPLPSPPPEGGAK